MFKKLFYLMTVFNGLIFCEKVKSLCEDPYIFASNILPNGTVRVYRGDYYWELTGLPDREAIVSGPFKIWLKYMAPVIKETSIMTVLDGPIAGNTWKFQVNRMWQWNENGELEVGGKGGVEWKEIPRGGFHCAMNDGDFDRKGYSQMIALKAIKAYYWKTTEKIFKPVGDVYNGHIGGQFGEQFPEDITSCMTFKSLDANHKYYVYLFKQKKYCFRPITGEKGCKEWRENTELFGCKKGGSGGSGSSAGKDNNNEEDEEKEEGEEKKPGDSKTNSQDLQGGEEGVTKTGQTNVKSKEPRGNSCDETPQMVVLLLSSALYFIYFKLF